MKNVVLEPNNMAGDVVVQYTETKVITKNLDIVVPLQYKAFVYIDEKISFRVESCNQKNVVKEYSKQYGDKLLGHAIKVAYILDKSLPQMMWGFGNINVANKTLNESYRVGANGKVTFKVTDYTKLMNAFPLDKPITIDDIHEKSISSIKAVGGPSLNKFVMDSNKSVFELNSLAGDFRKVMEKSVKDERIFNILGIEMVELTVDGIHVNEDDIEDIRNRVNN